MYYVFASDNNYPEWTDHAEADTFFCFTSLMAELRDLFNPQLDETDEGIEVRGVLVVVVEEKEEC